MGRRLLHFWTSRPCTLCGITDTRPVRVTNAGRPDAQTVNYLVEAGAPIAPDTPVDLTINDVLCGRVQAPKGSPDHRRSASSPARRRTTPRGKAQEFGVVSNQGGVAVRLDQLWTTPGETLIVYTVSAPPTFLGAAGAPVRILLEDGSFLRGLPLENHRQSTGKRVVSLPPLPGGATQLQIEFGPFMVATTGAYFDIDLTRETN